MNGNIACVSTLTCKRALSLKTLDSDSECYLLSNIVTKSCLRVRLCVLELINTTAFNDLSLRPFLYWVSVIATLYSHQLVSDLACPNTPPPQGCSGSICEKYGLEACTCASQDGKDETELCHVCCMEKSESFSFSTLRSLLQNKYA